MRAQAVCISTYGNVTLAELGGCVQSALEQDVQQVVAKAGPQHDGICNPVSPLSQLMTLVHRTMLNSTRDIGVFWLRLGMYVGLSVCLGTIYFQLGEGWNESARPCPMVPSPALFGRARRHRFTCGGRHTRYCCKCSGPASVDTGHSMIPAGQCARHPACGLCSPGLCGYWA